MTHWDWHVPSHWEVNSFTVTCDTKRNWDDKLANELMQNWVQWEERLPEQLTVPRSLAVHQEEVQTIELHAFGDASGKGVAAAVYAVVVQESGVT